MTHPASYNGNYQLLGPFEGDGTTFTPYRRGQGTPACGRQSSPSVAWREKSYWVALLERHMVPGDGGRLTLPPLTKGKNVRRGSVHVRYVMGFMHSAGERGWTSAEHAVGTEVDIESDQYLALFSTQVSTGAGGETVTEERIDCIPWETIGAISFIRTVSVESA
jgi:hypothetical protein